MNKPLQVGLIGFGVAGRYFHAPLIASTPGLRLAKIVQRHGHETYADASVVNSAEALLEDPAIDLVVIATPNSSHFSLAEQALLSGKHVVVDKPFTVTSTEAQQLIDTAQKQQRILSVFQNRRWDADFLTLQSLLASNVLGRVVEYEARFDRFRPQVNSAAWRVQDVPGAGQLYDLGAHLIDQALLLFGPPERVRAMLRQQREGVQAPDTFEVALDYAHHTATLKAGLLIREPGPQIAVHGTRGSFLKPRCDPQENALRKGGTPLDAGWGEEPREHWGRLKTDIDGLVFDGHIESRHGSYQSYYLNVRDAIRSGAPLAVTAEQARDVIRTIELAMASHATCRAIAWSNTAA